MILITLCMIVKDEEATLPNCLKAIARYMDEIIIVDTGSTDRTKEIALEYTDKVLDFPWVNDFAAARNFSINQASNEYILALDADEIIENIDIKEIEGLIVKYPRAIGRLLCINEYTRKGTPYKLHERVKRLFSKQYYKYEGTIHEQIISINDAVVETYKAPITVRHSGYEGDIDTRMRKTERNISLLKSALLLNPEDPYLLYQLGKSYYMEENYINACTYLGQALYFDLDIKLEYVQDLVESYGYSLINAGQYETAMQLLNVYEDFSHSADFIFMIALVLMNNEQFSRAIEEFEKATKKHECKMEGTNDYLAFYNIAVIYECLGDTNNALQYYLKCKDYEPAKNRLKIISKE